MSNGVLVRRHLWQTRIVGFFLALGVLSWAAATVYNAGVNREQNEEAQRQAKQIRQQSVQIRRQSQRTCMDLEKLKSQFRMTVKRGIKSLPTIAYYRKHPDELDRALAQNRETLRTFKARRCH